LQDWRDSFDGIDHSVMGAIQEEFDGMDRIEIDYKLNSETDFNMGLACDSALGLRLFQPSSEDHDHPAPDATGSVKRANHSGVVALT